MSVWQREEVQEVLRRPSRKLIASAIILFWLVMMGLLLRREGLFPFMRSRGAPVSPRMVRPSDTWMGIYLAGGGSGESRIGFVNTNTTPDSREGRIGVAFTVTAKLRLTLLAIPTEIFIAGAAWIPQFGGTAEFDFKIRSAEHAMRIAATVADGVLNATIHTGGETIPLRLPVGKDMLLAGAMGTMSLNIPVLKPNQEVYVDAFDPMTFSVGKAHIKCVGRETIEVAGESVKTNVIETTIGGLTSKAWVAEDEEVVRAETSFGFVLRKIAPQDALAPLSGSDNANLFKSMAVEPTGRKPFRGARRMIVRLGGMSEDKYPPVDDTQTAAGNEYTISVPAEPPRQPQLTSGLEEYLISDAFVQADHPKVKDAARKVVEGETDDWKRALRLYDWVYRNIRKVPVFSIPSALDVLETREGDCNEHTVLYTALARAADIPTRIAIGLVWSEEMGGFYYHAWPEVYVGRWIWMDPTLGQPIADATHLKLLNGGIERWPQLLPYLGQLQIEVLAIE